MFAGDVFSPPSEAADDLKLLVGGDSALVLENVGLDLPPVLKIHPWPSWLTKGQPKVVDYFLNFFYVSDLSEFESVPGVCPHCS